MECRKVWIGRQLPAGCFGDYPGFIKYLATTGAQFTPQFRDILVGDRSDSPSGASSINGVADLQTLAL